jgi:hypothetical protein
VVLIGVCVCVHSMLVVSVLCCVVTHDCGCHVNLHTRHTCECCLGPGFECTSNTLATRNVKQNMPPSAVSCGAVQHCCHIAATVSHKLSPHSLCEREVFSFNISTPPTVSHSPLSPNIASPSKWEVRSSFRYEAYCP